MLNVYNIRENYGGLQSDTIHLKTKKKQNVQAFKQALRQSSYLSHVHIIT